MLSKLVRNILWLSLFAFCAPLTAALSVDAATPGEIQNAIDRGKAYVYSLQMDGHWDAPAQIAPTEHNWQQLQGSVWGGGTAMAVYGLLAAGEKPSDVRLKPAIAFLRSTAFSGVYPVSMRAQVWRYLPKSKETRAAAQHDANLLLEAMVRSGEGNGLWHYLLKPTKSPDYDLSVSQLAVLGVWACGQVEGVEIPERFWQLEDQVWRKHQNASGAWSYITGARSPDGDDRASMTAAGVATLFLTHENSRLDQGFDCRGDTPDLNIDRGLAWIENRFPEILQGGFSANTYPYLCYMTFAMERVGAASGLKYFGKIGWFDEIADRLVKTQGAGGAWRSDYPLTDLTDTCFAIATLSKGRAPIAINKLQYANAAKASPAPTFTWNQRPRDVANLVQWMGRETEFPLNWQVLDLDASISDLHDAPILYISGSQPVQLTPQQQLRLKDFMETGGMLLANADCSQKAFYDSIRRLIAHLFPNYEFAELPADHPIYTHQQYQRARWKVKPQVEGLSNGVRLLAIIIPTADLGRAWQVNSGRQELFQLAADIYQYSNDQQSSIAKGISFWVDRDNQSATNTAIKVARLKYSGNWDPEPGGWRRLANLLHNQRRLDLSVEPVELGRGKLQGYKLAHLTGTDKVVFDAAAQMELKAFLVAGGILIVDAAGGRSEFARSIEPMLSSVLGTDAAQLKVPLSNDDMFYKQLSFTEPIFRRSSRSTIGNSKLPQLRVAKIQGRLALIYSPEDLSAGIVGEEVDGILGYTPEVATQIMTSIVSQAAGL